MQALTIPRRDIRVRSVALWPSSLLLLPLFHPPTQFPHFSPQVVESARWDRGARPQAHLPGGTAPTPIRGARGTEKTLRGSRWVSPDRRLTDASALATEEELRPSTPRSWPPAYLRVPSIPTSCAASRSQDRRAGSH